MLLEKALGWGGPTSIPRCLQYHYVRSKIWCPYATSSKNKKKTAKPERKMHNLYLLHRRN